jgi:hypothetical protein
VPAAQQMNVGSGLQIRQLLFPDASEGGVRCFRAPNPRYEEQVARGDKPRPRKYLELELHGMWAAPCCFPRCRCCCCCCCM